MGTRGVPRHQIHLNDTSAVGITRRAKCARRFRPYCPRLYWRAPCSANGMARSLAVSLVLALFFTTHSHAEPLKPAWSRSLGKGARLVGVEEYGRCILFANRKSIQIVSPENGLLWTWPYASIGRFLNPSDVAVSPDCDAIAMVGDATYKFAWIAQRTGRLVTVELT